MHALLFATVALAGLPILLHLLMKPEPKRLPFPALRFLLQKQKTNQRKLRLRHILLLLLRVLVIALFGVALYQPTLFSQSLNFAAEQPVAAVIVIDTSPSMGYAANGVTRLDDARKRVAELLDDLPPGSRVAIVDPADPGTTWEPSVADARKKLDAFKEPRGAAVPVTAGLAAAYQLLRTADEEAGEGQQLPRLVAVFSDRTAACWDAARVEDLKKLRDTVPAPAVAHLFIDVGVDQPADVAVTGIELAPQIVPQNQPVLLTATVSAAGPAVPDVIVTCRVMTANVPELKQTVNVPAGSPAAVRFKFDGLPPGVHHAVVALDKDRKDALPANDVRYVTFAVAEPRKVLTLCDDPPAAALWQLAHDAVGEFAVEVKRPAEAESFAGFEAVCVLAVAEPPWAKLRAYADAGGKVLLLPGGDVTGFNRQAADAVGVLPAELGIVADSADGMKPLGVPWLIDDAAMRHPLLAKFRDWKLRGNVDVVNRPSLAWKFWTADLLPEGRPVAAFDLPDEGGKRPPAVIERLVGGKGGKAVLLTTRLDVAVGLPNKWNDYWDTDKSSWYVVLPNLLLRYLCGDPAAANFNHRTGQPVAVPLPPGERKAGWKLQLEGPGVAARDATIEPTAAQTEVRLPPERTMAAGHFTLISEDKTWRAGFAVNAPAEESTLDKLPAEAVEGLFGPGSVVPVERQIKLRDALATSFDQPVDLFPWLLIGVLLLLAVEGVVANRFYRGQK